MPQPPHQARLRDNRSGRWAVTRPPQAPQQHTIRHVALLVMAGVLGLILGVGLGPIVGAVIDASSSTRANEPGMFLATAATRLREFQYRVSAVSVGDLIDTVTPAVLTRDRQR